MVQRYGGTAKNLLGWQRMKTPNVVDLQHRAAEITLKFFFNKTRVDEPALNRTAAEGAADKIAADIAAGGWLSASLGGVILVILVALLALTLSYVVVPRLLARWLKPGRVGHLVLRAYPHSFSIGLSDVTLKGDSMLSVINEYALGGYLPSRLVGVHADEVCLTIALRPLLGKLVGWADFSSPALSAAGERSKLLELRIVGLRLEHAALASTAQWEDVTTATACELAKADTLQLAASLLHAHVLGSGMAVGASGGKSKAVGKAGVKGGAKPATPSLLRRVLGMCEIVLEGADASYVDPAWPGRLRVRIALLAVTMAEAAPHAAPRTASVLPPRITVRLRGAHLWLSALGASGARAAAVGGDRAADAPPPNENAFLAIGGGEPAAAAAASESGIGRPPGRWEGVLWAWMGRVASEMASFLRGPRANRAFGEDGEDGLTIDLLRTVRARRPHPSCMHVLVVARVPPPLTLSALISAAGGC